MLKIGIIKECKTPPDTRVALTPVICRKILDNFTYLSITVQESTSRCYSDSEYKAEGIKIEPNVSDCDILIGVKEVPIDLLINNKTYFFFSHTIKEQAYNRALLKALVEKNIKMIDWEALTNSRGGRLIAFGKFAGMVGAHNAIHTYQQSRSKFKLKRMHTYKNYAEVQKHYEILEIDQVRIVLSGTGRVGMGAALVLKDMGYQELSPKDYLNQTMKKGVFTQLQCKDYVFRKSDGGFHKKEFYSDPKIYSSSFKPYTKCSDIFINGIYWDNDAPAFFSSEDMKNLNFTIGTIADITCDIAPLSSVPSTLRPSTIEDPVYGYDPNTGKEVKAYEKGAINIMAIDNLPNELPRDASQSFSEQFYENILSEIDDFNNSKTLSNATVTEKKDLGAEFEYLRNYLNG